MLPDSAAVCVHKSAFIEQLSCAAPNNDTIQRRKIRSIPSSCHHLHLNFRAASQSVMAPDAGVGRALRDALRTKLAMVAAVDREIEDLAAWLNLESVRTS